MPSPAHRHGRVHADEDEEGPAAERVQDRLAAHVRRHPALAPVLRHEVQEVTLAREGRQPWLSIQEPRGEGEVFGHRHCLRYPILRLLILLLGPC